MTTCSHEVHIEIHFRDNQVDVNAWYAATEEILRAAESWVGEQGSCGSGIDLKNWLESHGGKLDRTDGPARVEVSASGERVEEWYHDGQLDRTSGPAYVATGADGALVEVWVRAGKRDRADGPAYVETRADGFRSLEEWYQNGKLLRKERFSPVCSLPGVRLHPAAPKP